MRGWVVVGNPDAVDAGRLLRNPDVEIESFSCGDGLLWETRMLKMLRVSVAGMLLCETRMLKMRVVAGMSETRMLKMLRACFSCGDPDSVDAGCFSGGDELLWETRMSEDAEMFQLRG